MIKRISDIVISMWLSKKQKLAMDMVNKLVEKFDEGRCFTQHELPDITLHTMDALVSKGYLESNVVPTAKARAMLTAQHIIYYRRVKISVIAPGDTGVEPVGDVING